MGPELKRAIDEVVVESVAAEALPTVDRVPGVRALDLWRDGGNAAMLFWVEAAADVAGTGEPVLYEVYAERADGGWQAGTSAWATSGPTDEWLAGVPAGLHRVGGSSANRVFLTWAIATPEVALIRLRDEAGRVRDRPPGRDGFVLLGITSDDPLTRAYAVDEAGGTVPGEPLTLWAPPRG